MKEALSGNAVSGFLKRATDILFINDPVATSVGVLVGFVLQGTVGILNPVFKTLPIDLSAFTGIHYLALGILLSNFVANLRHRPFPPSVAQAFAVIHELERIKKISKDQAKLLYMGVIRKVVESVSLDEETKERARLLNDVLRQDLPIR